MNRTVKITISYEEIENADGIFETSEVAFKMEREDEAAVEGTTDAGLDFTRESSLGLASEVLSGIDGEFVDALDAATDSEESAD
jgi:hypothetical protein